MTSQADHERLEQADPVVGQEGSASTDPKETERVINQAGSELAAPFKELEPHLGNTPIAPAHGIAALALTMALKYHDTTIIKDGALYQQYKLEGRNIPPLILDEVFETAIRIEMHLLGSSDRIAKLIVDALVVQVEDDDSERTMTDEADEQTPPSREPA